MKTKLTVGFMALACVMVFSSNASFADFMKCTEQCKHQCEGHEHEVYKPGTACYTCFNDCLATSR